MSLRTRLRLAQRWKTVLHPDADLAQAEGRAAGLGLLTGEVARSAGPATDIESSCPSCGGATDIAVIDLVGRSTTLRCRSCGRRWTSAHPATTAPGS